jgi:hypothetical protein
MRGSPTIASRHGFVREPVFLEWLLTAGSSRRWAERRGPGTFGVWFPLVGPGRMLASERHSTPCPACFIERQEQGEQDDRDEQGYRRAG